MKSRILTIAFLIGVMPSAVAGMFSKEDWEREDCPLKHSLAWCIADYHGRAKGIHDMSREDFVETLKKAGISDENQLAEILHSGLGVSAGVGMAALGNLLGGSVFILHALMPDEVDQNRRDPYVEYFDTRTGRSKKQILEDFDAVVFGAIKSAVSSLPKEVSVIEIEKDRKDQEFLGKPIERHIRYFEIKTSATDEVPDPKKIYAIGPGNNLFSTSEEFRKPPEYMGSSPVISARIGTTSGIWFDPPPGVNRAELAMSISKELPAWMYWFIPTGYLGTNPFPLMLNQGKALFFVKPTKDAPVPVMPHVAARLEAEKHSTTTEIAPMVASASAVIQTTGDIK